MRRKWPRTTAIVRLDSQPANLTAPRARAIISSQMLSFAHTTTQEQATDVGLFVVRVITGEQARVQPQGQNDRCGFIA